MSRIKLDRPGLDSARGYVGTLTANCELDQKKAQNARAAVQAMDFAGRSALIAQLDSIAARLSKQADRMQRLGTMMGAVGDELAKADVAAGTTSQMLWDQIWSGGRSGAGASSSLSPGASAALERVWAGLFTGTGTDLGSMGTVPIFRDFLGMLLGKKAVDMDGHSGMSFDGKKYISSRQTFDQNTRFFDYSGSYGGNQSHLTGWKKGINVFGDRWFEDKQVFAYVRSHPGYEYYTDEQIAQLLDQMANKSCGYIAAVNSVFVAYEGREEEFQNRFGFPMYDELGNENYDYLYLDIFLETDNKYYLDEPNGLNALYSDAYAKYYENQAEFEAQFGPFPSPDKPADRRTVQRLIDRYADGDTATMSVDGVSKYALDNRLQHYMSQKGVSMKGEIIEDQVLPPEKVRQYIQEGKSVNLATYNIFTLYDEFDEPVALCDTHWMTITGTTEDGDYIVSSWGNRYYVKPEELQDPNWDYSVDYYVLSVEPNIPEPDLWQGGYP